MFRYLKMIIVLGLFSAGLLFTACGSKSDGDARKKAAVESVLPAFSLLNMQGESVDSQQFAGAVLVVDFWATWCKPCIHEIPAYNKLYEKYRDKNFKLIGITMDSGDLSQILPFAEKNNMAYPIYLGNQSATVPFGGVEGYPKTFVVDQKGNILKSFLGAGEGKVEEIDQMVETLLGEGV